MTNDRDTSAQPEQGIRFAALGAAGGLALCGLVFVGLLQLPMPTGDSLTRAIPGRGGELEANMPPLELGALLFKRYACAACHEIEGAGTGIDVPPSLSFAGSRAQEEWIIGFLKKPYPIRFASDGVRPELVMPDFSLTDPQAAALAAFVSERRDTTLIPEVEPPPADATQAAEGEKLIGQYQCRGCHTIGKEGAEIGPHLDGVGARLRPQYMRALLSDPDRVVPGTPMKNMELWEEELEAILQFLRTLKH